jgi:hypothetical protein
MKVFYEVGTMIALPFSINHTWVQSPRPTAGSGEERGYDFHTFRLEAMDVIWAWTLVAGVVLLLMFLT